MKKERIMLDRHSVDGWVTEYTTAVLAVGCMDESVENRLSSLMLGKLLLVELIMSNVENSSRIPSVSTN
jgi:hypothetical protein